MARYDECPQALGLRPPIDHENTIAAVHATAKKMLTWSQSISLLYEILEVRCLGPNRRETD